MIVNIYDNKSVLIYQTDMDIPTIALPIIPSIGDEICIEPDWEYKQKTGYTSYCGKVVSRNIDYFSGIIDIYLN